MIQVTANMIATDPDGTILDALYRRPKRGEISGGTYRAEDLARVHALVGDPEAERVVCKLKAARLRRSRQHRDKQADSAD